MSNSSEKTSVQPAGPEDGVGDGAAGAAAESPPPQATAVESRRRKKAAWSRGRRSTGHLPAGPPGGGPARREVILLPVLQQVADLGEQLHVGGRRRPGAAASLAAKRAKGRTMKK